MRNLLLLIILLWTSIASAQVQQLNDIIRNNGVTSARTANALDAGTSFTAAGTDTYTVSTGLGIYSGVSTYEADDQFTVIFPNANTGTTPTLNVNGEGAITIVDNKGDPVAVGDVHGVLKLMFDGTNFRIVGGTGSGGGSTAKVFPFAVTDEVIPITTGTGVISFRIPYAVTLTGIRASLVTGQTSGSIITVDIKESGTTILSTLLTFDNGETTTVTATTPLVISDTSIADDAVITVDITQVGDGTGAGLKITLYGN